MAPHESRCEVILRTSLEDFCKALSAYLKCEVLPTSELWRNLRIGGDDWDAVMYFIQKEMRLQLPEDLNINMYIPQEWSIGLLSPFRPKLKPLAVTQLFEMLEPSHLPA